VKREWIIERLQRPGGGLGGDHAVAGDTVPAAASARPAAVLVPLVERPDGLTVLLTQRTEHLHHHPGQICFPGGSLEAGDADPVAAALRETEEEIGLGAGQIEVVGQLDPYHTLTGFVVTPVVGLIRPDFELHPDPFEVAEVFEVPLSFVLDPANYQPRQRLIGGERHRFFALVYEGRYIWGATAAMLLNLQRRLCPEGEAPSLN